ncbi:Sulfotransferase family protein [Paracoccus thiocyanatus]|uniref:Sulfotransferase family protein n=1 Tax=Paracoccus thiocyanatus TaxID=34006 RepID=A0A1N6R529_9RHOB|nr:sulfotransferase family 2 domain-containing protein [Paracoccus thiocyanatus]SIQ23975.1 Sulfotransferase family protein [Paracoccus thiocyanatus]
MAKDAAAHAMGSVFLGPALRPGPAAAQAEALHQAYPQDFSAPEAAAQFLRSIHMPASFRWAFLNNGKSGTSSARRLLFELEFGVPLTAKWDVPGDINSDAIVHHMQGPAGILRPALVIPNGVARLESALRITTVRHPVDRALSGFDYLCRSHELRHGWFSADRLRMNAMVGFDWSRHPRTEQGFARFLHYVARIRAEAGSMSVDPHWRAQIENIRPAIFRPDLIGRVEDMPGFFAELATRLDRPLPEDNDRTASNQQDHRSERSALLSAANRAAIRELYAADFEWLGYDPEDR